MSKNSEVNEERYLIKVAEEMPSLSDCSAFVSDPSCGAISTFIGITRNNFQNKKVTKLSYEGYVPMAEKELRKICVEANKKYPSIVKLLLFIS